jgi:hypothetical protein
LKTRQQQKKKKNIIITNFCAIVSEESCILPEIDEIFHKVENSNDQSTEESKRQEFEMENSSADQERTKFQQRRNEK